jgi:RNA polymerase sigma-70 factor (ECF subfamily)
MEQRVNAGQQAELSDGQVIAEILNGKKHMFELLMRKYNARLYRVAMSIIKNDTEAEDIMQAAYIKAYEKLDSFEQRSTFGTWITRILINEGLGRQKKQKRFVTMAEDNTRQDTGAAQNPGHQLVNKELRMALEQAMLQLPEKYRLVFVLREVEDMSIAETVDTLGITEANVKVRLNRAKTMLRDSLSSYYKNEGIFDFHLSRCDRVVNTVLQKLGI